MERWHKEGAEQVLVVVFVRKSACLPMMARMDGRRQTWVGPEAKSAILYDFRL